MKIDLWHNILWSRYKGAVFSELSAMCQRSGVEIRFFQIAKTESAQALLAPVDYSFHKYDYELIFDTNYAEPPLWKMLYETGRRVWASDADVILLAGYSRPEYFVQLFLAKLQGKKVAVFCDSTALDRRKSTRKFMLKKMFFTFCDGVYGYGRRSFEYVAEHGVAPDRIFYPVQTAPAIVDLSEAEIVARRQNVYARPPHFVYVGRLAPEKGLPVLLEAFARFHVAHPQARLSIIGAGALRDALVAQIEALDVAEAVCIPGAQSGAALAEVILDASALILPSISEPWGLVVNEALGLGVPVIVSDRCGCVPELVAEGRTGYVVRAADVVDLHDKLETLQRTFIDGAAVARTCLAQVAPYTALASAKVICDGVRKIALGSFAAPQHEERNDESSLGRES